MNRKTISEEQVYELAFQMKKGGEEPSSKAIREQLGSGSLSTISKYLKEWRELQGTPKQEVLEELDINEIFDGIDSETIMEFFLNEHPQIIALSFSYLEPSKAASILKSFPEKLKEEVLIRMETMGPVQSLVVQQIFRVLKDEFEFIRINQSEQPGGKELVMKIKKEMGIL